MKGEETNYKGTTNAVIFFIYLDFSENKQEVGRCTSQVNSHSYTLNQRITNTKGKDTKSRVLFQKLIQHVFKALRQLPCTNIFIWIHEHRNLQLPCENLLLKPKERGKKKTGERLRSQFDTTIPFKVNLANILEFKKEKRQSEKRNSANNSL